MIARHDGAIALVSGTIPGERVEAEVEKVQRGTIWARTVRVIDASPDRVLDAPDGSCGGHAYAHIRYERQCALKRDVVRDAFARIGRMSVPDDVTVTASPLTGYRMRARLHVKGGQIGFFREGTHELCAPAGTGQLLPASIDALHALAAVLASSARDAITDVELAENIPATERVAHLVLAPGVPPVRLRDLGTIEGLSGVSCGPGTGGSGRVLHGGPTVSDELPLSRAEGSVRVTLRRQAHAFFQANRFLLPDLVSAVISAVPERGVVDLYAGVGLFAVPLAAIGRGRVIAVEGDATSASDLAGNAAPLAGILDTRAQSVESFLATPRPADIVTVIVDPPRTGMSRVALEGVIRWAPRHVTYVSCDVATLARDARLLADAGYALIGLRAFDLFPQTAHVEALALFAR